MKIPDYEDIETLADLESLLAFLRKAVDEGVLIQNWDNEQIGMTKERVDQVPIKGPYPDNIVWQFYSPATGKYYEVGVDVYHGGGGEWRAVES